MTLFINLFGLTLLFVGGSLVNNALCRWGSTKNWRWKVGQPMQTIGYVISLIAILLSAKNVSLSWQFNLSETVNIIELLVLCGALIVGWLSWSRSRAVYEIARQKLPINVGDSVTTTERQQIDELQKRLQTGKWVVLNTTKMNDDHFSILLGRIKY